MFFDALATETAKTKMKQEDLQWNHIPQLRGTKQSKSGLLTDLQSWGRITNSYPRQNRVKANPVRYVIVTDL